MYDALSLSFVKLGLFPPLIKSILAQPADQLESCATSRVLELCACHKDGIRVLQDHLEPIVCLCDRFLASSHDLVSVRYPAATVLLDLTASEDCIERVGTLIMQKNMIEVVLRELRLAMTRKLGKTSLFMKVYH